MKIYHNSTIVAVLKRFIPHKGGDYLNHLVWIDLQEYPDGEINVFPVYRALRFRKIPDGRLIEIPFRKKQLVILISKDGIYHEFVAESQLHLSDVGNGKSDRCTHPEGGSDVRL